ARPQVRERGAQQRARVDPVVPPEARVLAGEEGVDDDRRYVAQRDEAAALLVELGDRPPVAIDDDARQGGPVVLERRERGEVAGQPEERAEREGEAEQPEHAGDPQREPEPPHGAARGGARRGSAGEGGMALLARAGSAAGKAPARRGSSAPLPR